MLPCLPRDRRRLEVGQVTGDPDGADLHCLQQRRAAGHRVTAAAPEPFGGHGLTLMTRSGLARDNASRSTR